MILHDITSGESTTLPANGVMDYSVQSENGTANTRISIQRRSFGPLLQVNAGTVYVNDRPVQEMALLTPGDLLTVGGKRFVLVSEDDLPVQYSAACTPENTARPGEYMTPQHGSANKIIGLRWLGGVLGGHFQAVESGMAIACDGVLVQGVVDGLVLYPEKSRQASQLNSPVRVNGYTVFKANNAPITLRHGDVVQSGQWRFRAEIPGSAGMSAFSPSHPHNIQLSEEYLPENVTSSQRSQETRQWLWVMVAGLALVLAVTVWLKQ